MSKIQTKYKCNLPVIFFREGNKVIAYTPALDLSTCGKDLAQAKKRFKEMVDIFFKETEDLEEVLLECGWQKVAHPPSWIPPSYIGQTQEEVYVPLRV
jgi:hypothetical protein